jgi:hypothetical protein
MTSRNLENYIIIKHASEKKKEKQEKEKKKWEKRKYDAMEEEEWGKGKLKPAKYFLNQAAAKVSQVQARQ